MRCLGLDVGNAKIKLCLGRPGERPELVTRLLPYSDRRPYARQDDIAAGTRDALAEALAAHPDQGDPVVAVAVTSAGYAYPSFRDGVRHLAGVLAEALPGTRVFLLSATLAPVAVEQARGGDAGLLGPVAFSNPNGAAWLARRLGALGPSGAGLVLDTGGQTTGTLVLDGARVDPAALADPARHVAHRVAHGKLLWYGVETTPLEYVASEVEVAGERLPVTARGVPFWNVAALLDLLPPERARRLSLLGRLPSRALAHRALADAVGLDAELLDEASAVALARAFHERAIESLAAGLARARATAPGGAGERAVCFGLGASALAAPALARAGVADVTVAADRWLDAAYAEAASCFGPWHLALELAAGHPVAVVGARP